MIPPTAHPAGVTVRALSDGRFEVVCGRCLHTSEPVTAGGSDAAWAALEGSGWVHFKYIPASTGYALCPHCQAKNETIEDSVRAARRKRRWK